MGENVQFVADFSKLGLAKKNTITLELPESVKLEKVVEIARMRGQRITVIFGDPQMEMEFDEDEQPKQSLSGTQYEVDAAGVVGGLKKQEEADEEDQAWLNFDDAGSQEASAKEAGESEQTDEEAEQESPVETPTGNNDRSFQPDWLAEESKEADGVA